VFTVDGAALDIQTGFRSWKMHLAAGALRGPGQVDAARSARDDDSDGEGASADVDEECDADFLGPEEQNGGEESHREVAAKPVARQEPTLPVASDDTDGELGTTTTLVDLDQNGTSEDTFVAQISWLQLASPSFGHVSGSRALVSGVPDNRRRGPAIRWN
jgi:hypothetical protein